MIERLLDGDPIGNVQTVEFARPGDIYDYAAAALGAELDREAIEAAFQERLEREKAKQAAGATGSDATN